MPSLAQTFFIFGLMFLSFAYGIATANKELFPYSILLQARTATVAWLEVLGVGAPNQFVLPGLETFETGVPPHPVIKNVAAGVISDDEVILMTGGPYEHLDLCPQFGCLAWLMTRDGDILHTWEVNLEELWSDVTGFHGLPENRGFFPIGLLLDDNGDLVVTFQAKRTFPYTVGIAKVDVQGEILWKKFDYSHHWPGRDQQGRIFTPATRIVDSPLSIGNTPTKLVCGSGKIYEDLVRVFSPVGELLWEVSMVEALANSQYSGVLSATRDACDPIHLNSIEVASPEIAQQVAGVSAGDLLVSMRSPNAVFVMGQEDGEIKHAVVGRTIGQHSPRFLPDGRILVFDNQAGDEADGGTRVIRLDLNTGELDDVFPGPATEGVAPVFTATAGHIDLSDDGTRALVSLSHQGRVVEVDVASGKVLWEYDKVFDIGPFLEKEGNQVGVHHCTLDHTWILLRDTAFLC